MSFSTIPLSSALQYNRGSLLLLYPSQVLYNTTEEVFYYCTPLKCSTIQQRKSSTIVPLSSALQYNRGRFVHQTASQVIYNSTEEVFYYHTPLQCSTIQQRKICTPHCLSSALQFNRGRFLLQRNTFTAKLTLMCLTPRGMLYTIIPLTSALTPSRTRFSATLPSQVL